MSLKNFFRSCTNQCCPPSKANPESPTSLPFMHHPELPTVKAGGQL